VRCIDGVSERYGYTANQIEGSVALSDGMITRQEIFLSAEPVDVSRRP
jgi:hypothetical protein